MLDGAGIDIDVFGRLEADYVVAPARHTLDVNQVFDADVVGGDVAAAGTATKTQRGVEVIVDPAQSANRSRRIDDDPTGVDSNGKTVDYGVVFGKDTGRVSRAAGII